MSLTPSSRISSAKPSREKGKNSSTTIPTATTATTTAIQNGEFWQFEHVEDLILTYISKLIPKPSILVFNAGHWPNKFHVLAHAESVVNAAVSVFERVIWKSTSYKQYGARSSLNDESDAVMSSFQNVEYVNMNWTSLSSPADYFDDYHFFTQVYADMNIQLIRQLMHPHNNNKYNNIRESNEVKQTTTKSSAETEATAAGTAQHASFFHKHMSQHSMVYSTMERDLWGSILNVTDTTSIDGFSVTKTRNFYVDKTLSGTLREVTSLLQQQRPINTTACPGMLNFVNLTSFIVRSKESLMQHIIREKIDDFCDYFQFLSVWDGAVVKLDRLPSVYLIQNGTTQEFQSSTAFTSRGYDFGQVRQISKEEFQRFPVGERLF